MPSDIPFWLRFLIAALAVYRLARMIALEDGPFDMFLHFREWAGAYDYGENGKPTTSLGYLAGCPLCIGVWLSFLATIWVVVAGDISGFVMLWFAIAGLQVFFYKLSEP